MAVAAPRPPTMASMTETIQPQETLQMKLTTKPASNVTPHPPSMPKMKNHLRLDPQRALEPARKKLSTVEAQRVMAVLLESIRRTDLVSILPYLLENLDRFTVLLGSDLVQMLKDHQVMIQSFEELRSTAERLLEKERKQAILADEEEEMGEEEEDRKSERTHSSGSKRSGKGSRPASADSITSQADSAMRNLALVAKQMQYSTKKVLRAFSLSPAALTTILKDQSQQKTPQTKEMICEMNELKDIIMGMLLTTPVEEMERNHYLRAISERERYNAGVIDKLESELQAALNDKDNEVNDVLKSILKARHNHH